MSSKDGARCERCGHEGPWRRPGLAPRVALAGVYVLFVLMLVGAALTGLGIVAFGPLAVALAVLMQAPPPPWPRSRWPRRAAPAALPRALARRRDGRARATTGTRAAPSR
ncbi:MAG: hypothetical protein U0325_28430 [Polyangiales bacterium]